MNEEARKANELDRFLDELIKDSNIPAPVNGALSHEEVALARRLVRAEQGGSPNESVVAAAQGRVWREVLAGAPKTSARASGTLVWPTLFRPVSGTAWLRAGLTLAAVVFAVLVGLYITASQPSPVSAQEIITRAEETLVSPSRQGVQSFVLTETQRTVPGNLRLNAYARLKGDESLLIQVQRWYQAPNRWRSEYVQKVVTPDGRQERSEESIHLSDGKDLWQYSQSENFVSVDPLDPNMDVRGEGGLFGQSAETLRELFSQVNNCYDPKVSGKETVAGRPTYVVDLGATKCPSASGPEMQGRIIIWVDQETSFVLKTEQHSKFDDKVIVTTEVTSVQYNVPIDPARFVLTPPAGAQLLDNRGPH